MKKKIAKFIRIMKDWHAPTLLFKVNPPVNGKKHIIVAAANSVDFYTMAIYTREKNSKGGYVYRLIEDLIKNHQLLKCNLPDFKGALERIGYTMIGDVQRFPRVKRFPR